MPKFNLSKSGFPATKPSFWPQPSQPRTMRRSPAVLAALVLLGLDCGSLGWGPAPRGPTWAAGLRRGVSARRPERRLAAGAGDQPPEPEPATAAPASSGGTAAGTAAAGGGAGIRELPWGYGALLAFQAMPLALQVRGAGHANGAGDQRRPLTSRCTGQRPGQHPLLLQHCRALRVPRRAEAKGATSRPPLSSPCPGFCRSHPPCHRLPSLLPWGRLPRSLP